MTVSLAVWLTVPPITAVAVPLGGKPMVMVSVTVLAIAGMYVVALTDEDEIVTTLLDAAAVTPILVRLVSPAIALARLVAMDESVSPLATV